jgi:hypothetical protein
MLRVSAVAIAVLIAMSFGISGALAQATTDKAPAKKPMATDQKPSQMDSTTDKTARKVEGKIKSVAGSMVTLEDGTKLAIPKSLMVPMAQLKPGAVIAAEYEKKSGRKVATSVQIKS